MATLGDDSAPANGIQTGMSAKQRLSQAMRMASNDNLDPDPSNGQWSSMGTGIPNPYGRGLAAFEPNNVLFDGYGQAKATSDNSKMADAAAAQMADGKINVLTNTGDGSLVPGGDPGVTMGNATGKVGAAVQAALALAARKVPYVWGGTSATGVDCSGMLYYAFKAAGIDTKRYRAVDYGHMGQAVSAADARPGDVIYYDEPGDTDHVGLYIGNGQMVQAPQTGDVVKVSSIGKPTSIRRLFDDDQFDTIATPTGGTTVSYNGRPIAVASSVIPASGAGRARAQ